MTYEATRTRVETYFDKTATRTWEQLTSDAPVSGIRATVRAGRDRMRDVLLSQLPLDLQVRAYSMRAVARALWRLSWLSAVRMWWALIFHRSLLISHRNVALIVLPDRSHSPQVTCLISVLVFLIISSRWTV